MRTEFEFCLPTGYMDEWGQVHHNGMMRRSRAMDEITPMEDSRVQANPAYATVLILSRVIVQIGNITDVTPEVIENLFASDLGYLQALYQQVNSPDVNHSGANSSEGNSSAGNSSAGNSSEGSSSGVSSPEIAHPTLRQTIESNAEHSDKLSRELAEELTEEVTAV